jgi:hypothetical protein
MDAPVSEFAPTRHSSGVQTAGRSVELEEEEAVVVVARPCSRGRFRSSALAVDANASSKNVRD